MIAKTKFITAISTAIAGAAAPAMLFLGATTASAAPDNQTVESQDGAERPLTTTGGFDPRPEMPGPNRPCRTLVVNGILICDS